VVITVDKLGDWVWCYMLWIRIIAMKVSNLVCFRHNSCDATRSRNKPHSSFIGGSKKVRVNAICDVISTKTDKGTIIFHRTGVMSA
jgi:hypothetical protein